MTSTPSGSSTAQSRFSLFDDLTLHMQFTPVCRLTDGALAAVELQLRGPTGTRVGTARALRRAARTMEQPPERDRRKLQFTPTPQAQSLAKILPLLVSLDLDLLDDLGDATLATVERHVMVVLPNAMDRSPQRTLAKVARAREEGRIVCVDGVSTSTQAATLLSLVEPDIVVTSADLLADNASQEPARVAHALAAHIERSHAVVIADGVDTDAKRIAAMTIGAAYGTGALYPSSASPSAFTSSRIVALPDLPVWSTPPPKHDTPSAIASATTTPRLGDKRLLIEMSEALENQAAIGGGAVVLGTFQHARHFTPTTAQRWRVMSERTGLAGVYGVDLVDIREGNVHRAPLDPDDDLVNEWTVAVLGPHFTALLSARDQHSGASDLDRTFEFVQSSDRVIVTQAVHSILMRLR